MSTPANVNQYLQNQYEGMDPKQLILMLYKGAVDKLALAREGIKENDPQKRGENLGKVIAIISELNSSLDTNMKDEGTEFLRGLYTSMLMELPKVSIDNNLEILDRADRYIQQLMFIWKTDVMGLSAAPQEKKPTKPQEKPVMKPRKKPAFQGGSPGYGYGNLAGPGGTSFSV